MKKSNKVIVAVCIVLLLAIAINLTGCAPQIQAKNLMDGITPNTVSALKDLDTDGDSITDFSLRLFREARSSNENTLISPLSVLCALAMTANGADGQTRAQMESALGMDVESLNLFLYSYLNGLPEGKKYKLGLANSIWFTEDERFVVNEDFLQANADYYGADIYKAPFDEQTLKDINHWVSLKTDEMIPNVLDRISDDAIMYLINALAFDAEWQNVYKDSQIQKGVFTKEDGTQQLTDMMYSSEGMYLEDDQAKGFIKYYSDGKYAFAALLPGEGVSVEEYIESLDGVSLRSVLSRGEKMTVKAAIPKFTTSYDTELSSVLQAMGMTAAFDGNQADFSKLGSYLDENIYINRVIHKTYIEVGEEGTRAGATTVVEMNKTSLERPDNHKEVYLNRPFVYMIIDCENNLPLFIGTMMDVQA